MPTQNFFLYAPVICSVVHLHYTVRCACKCCCPGDAELLYKRIGLSLALWISAILLGPSYLLPVVWDSAVKSHLAGLMSTCRPVWSFLLF